MKPLVLYHGQCWDGFCAAWVARKALGPDCDFVPVQYGQDPPDCAGRNVFILDFSFKRAAMIHLSQVAQKMVVLDHHISAAQELVGLSAGSDDGLIRFDMDKSGGRLAWEYFFRGQLSPWLVDYTEDRDLWRWKLPDSKSVNACLRSYPLEFELWDHFAQEIPQNFVQEGNAIIRRENQIVNEHIGHAREIDLDGHKVLAVNATVLFSEIAGELAKGRPFGACYFDRQDGKRQWSLRSEEAGIDVAELAKRHGGGGHTHAAGFEEGVT